MTKENDYRSWTKPTAGTATKGGSTHADVETQDSNGDPQGQERESSPILNGPLLAPAALIAVFLLSIASFTVYGVAAWTPLLPEPSMGPVGYAGEQGPPGKRGPRGDRGPRGRLGSRGEPSTTPGPSGPPGQFCVDGFGSSAFPPC
jgi:hypothetical protein